MLINRSALDPPRTTAWTLAACSPSSDAGSYRPISAARAQAAASCRCRSIAGKQQTSSVSLPLSIDGTDRRTDTRPLHRCLYRMYFAASVINECQVSFDFLPAKSQILILILIIYSYFSFLFFNFLFLKLQFMRIKMYILSEVRIR